MNILAEIQNLNWIYLIIDQKLIGADVDTSNLAAKTDLASSKAETDKIDIDKLKSFC